MPDLILLPDLDKRAPTLTLTPVIATKIVAALEEGSSRRGAARLAGVQEQALAHWLEEAQTRQVEPYITLLDRVLKAESAYEARQIKGGQKVAKTTDDYLHLLKSHPAHRDIWGGQDDEPKGITVQIGFKVDARSAHPVLTTEAALETTVRPHATALPPQIFTVTAETLPKP